MAITYKDVSHYNGAYKPTGPTVAKATQGSTFVDPQFAGIRARTLAGGWPFLAYHFLGHGNIASQVAHVISVIGHGQPLMLDVETAIGQPDATLTDVLDFADAYSHTGGIVTLVYLPHWYWSGHLHSPNLTGLTTRHIGLISSLYDHGHADDGPGWAPYGGVTPVIWQYTSTPLDTNAFKGTVTQLAELWAHGTRTSSNPSVPVQPPEEDMPTVQEIVDGIMAAEYPLGAGFSTKTTTVKAGLGFLSNTALQTRNLVLGLGDVETLAQDIAARLPAGGSSAADIKAALADVLTQGTASVAAVAG